MMPSQLLNRPNGPLILLTSLQFHQVLLQNVRNQRHHNRRRTSSSGPPYQIWKSTNRYLSHHLQSPPSQSTMTQIYPHSWVLTSFPQKVIRFRAGGLRQTHLRSPSKRKSCQECSSLGAVSIRNFWKKHNIFLTAQLFCIISVCSRNKTWMCHYRFLNSLRRNG